MKQLMIALWILLVPLWMQSQEIEPLLGFSADPQNCEVSIKVLSYGCTTVSDFRFSRQKDTLTIRRLRPDEGMMAADTIDLVFPLAAMDCMGMRSVILRNPILGKSDQRKRLNFKPAVPTAAVPTTSTKAWK